MKSNKSLKLLSINPIFSNFKLCKYFKFNFLLLISKSIFESFILSLTKLGNNSFISIFSKSEFLNTMFVIESNLFSFSPSFMTKLFLKLEKVAFL